MKNYKDSKTLIVIIIVLFLTNIALASAWWISYNNKQKAYKHGSEMNDFLKNEIGFSPAQLSTLEEFRQGKKEKDKVIFEAIREEKKQKYRELGAAAFSDSASAAAANYASEKQKQLELNMINSLKSIRQICTPGQRAKFDTSFYQIFNREKKGGRH